MSGEELEDAFKVAYYAWRAAHILGSNSDRRRNRAAARDVMRYIQREQEKAGHRVSGFRAESI